MSKRKYEEVKGYWVYSIKVASIGKYYIGVSKMQCHKRWQKSMYVGMSLEQYLDEWDSMVKTVLIDGLTKEQAYQYEGKIIDALNMNGLCINERRSGLIEVSDRNAYMREYRENNPEYREHEREYSKQYNKGYYENNNERINQQQKQYYQDNKEKVLEYKKQYYKRKKLEKQQKTSIL